MSRYVPISFNQYVGVQAEFVGENPNLRKNSEYRSLIYFGHGLMRDLIVEIGDAGVRSSFCDVKTRTGLLSRHLF